ncbi:putative zinc-finger of transcription factor IIIC complex-domain-containing protein [Leucosporidium creatinivorum]|uniref:Putative zinc-finger of transcription factor IIIC complex-domain-containing protein n=1 Tax=Leucosporidium creatinivorum TaxID=106004 RepID=A0A1Y2EH65_9BASI|nr:putative zinc-finger of transcription factor IIIC complex-domain-containing protein [Leucosporidium creatinivorum]
MAEPSTSTATIFARAQTLGTPLTPSPQAIVANEDGQLLVATRGELNIFTPAFGIQVDKAPETLPTPSVVAEQTKERSAKGKGKEKETQASKVGSQVPLFRTTIIVDKKDLVEWGGWVSEVQAAAGATDAHWRCATWSPTGLSSLGGCVLAAVTNNNEALLFEPEKNAYKGVWKESFDLTSHLIKLIITEDDLQPADGHIQTALDRRRLAARLHECHSTTAAWSPAVEGTFGDYSILAVGHRSGHISLWRKYPDGTMGVLHRYRMSDEAGSIPLISWSPWVVTEEDDRTIALACLAVADAEGRVWSVEVSQVVTAPHVGFAAAADSTIPDEEPADVWAIVPLLVCEPDRRPATQFRWISQEGAPRLVFTKIGTVSFATLEPTDIAVTGNYRVKETTELDLPPQGSWIGVSALSPCCGIEYLPERHAIIVALTDGSLHSITLDPQPAFTPSSPVLPSSSELTASMREVFERLGMAAFASRGDNKVKKVEWKEGSRVNGFAAVGDDGEVAWTYELMRPDTLGYKANSGIKSILIIASLFGSVSVEGQFARLGAIFASLLNARIRSPLTVLRSLLHFVHDHIADAAFCEELRNHLSPVDLPALPDMAQQHEDKVAATSAFVSKLFGETVLEQLRCREAIARFMLRLPNLPKSQRHDTLALHTTLARQIAREVTSRLGAVLSSSKGILGPQELAISGRILLASASLLPSPTTAPMADEPILPPDALSNAFEGTETCPACRAAIPFANIRKAACLNGHQWERCSITLAVVASVQVRTCTACERKALIKLVAEPASSPSKQQGQGGGAQASVEVINGILKTATCCLYCGGRWMRIR